MFPDRQLGPKKSWWLLPAGAYSAGAMLYAVFVVTFPDERIYLATNWVHGEWYRDTWGGIVAGRTPIWYDWLAPVNTLSLEGEDLIDDAKLAHIIEKNEQSANQDRWVPTLTLRGRDFTGANFENADVRHVDFSDAILNRSNFHRSWAEHTLFNRAHLQGAVFTQAQLQGASLAYGEAQLAQFSIALLEGATLTGAQLQGANFDGAVLAAASFDMAHLQAASLKHAGLRGASFTLTQLQGAWLKNADLRGALFDRTQLQGASLVNTNLQGASFRNVFVWRTDSTSAEWNDTLIAGVEISPKKPCYDPAPPPPKGKETDICSWTLDRFEELMLLNIRGIPGVNTPELMEFIESRLSPGTGWPGEHDMARVWTDHSSIEFAYKTDGNENLPDSSKPTVYEKSQGEQWAEAGCVTAGSPYVAKAIIGRLGAYDVYNNFSTAVPFGGTGLVEEKLAAAFLDTEHCPGARGLSEAEIARLKEIATKAKPPTPNEAPQTAPKP